MRLIASAACGVVAGLFGLAAFSAPATAQQSNCDPGQPVIRVPEIRSSGGVLRAEMTLGSTKRQIWGAAGDTRCVTQDIRFLTGRDLTAGASPADPAFSSGKPIPGPTFRVRVGDLIQIRFLNQVDTRNFSLSLDQGMSAGNTTGCDEVRSASGIQYPINDVMPNCLHGSSTSNIHFHGTHTTPSTTGDNITLFVRPAPRDESGEVTQDSAFVNSMFTRIWNTCAANGSPTRWGQLPQAWRDTQEALLKEYDATASFRGQPGALPDSLKLWPPNQEQIANGLWPQYQIGAYPYCFRLADPAENVMGQVPGTHWYHAHKHGSTALNVANGLTGVFVVEGQYDDDLRRFYGAGLVDQVLMIQQISTNPFPVLNPVPRRNRGERDKFRLSVNGQLNPVVQMRPGEVQLWRLVNGNYRDAVQLLEFSPLSGGSPAGVAWRQIAQDGAQFAFANYQSAGAVNRQLNLAPANRADLLVKAPLQPGRYALVVQPNEGNPLDSASTRALAVPQDTLLTLEISGAALSPAQDFIEAEGDFPTFPAYLADIPESEIRIRREVAFGAVHNLIDGQSFDPDEYSQVMRLNTAEEWKVTNAATDKAHPFHIHVNPFQITEVFKPNFANTSDPDMPCYVDPLDPDTWKPCTPLQGPYAWWDTFAIPTATTVDIPQGVCTEQSGCPEPIQPYTSCSDDQCSVTIPGHFKMRTRFVDFTGTYVIHCHILIHEDRGMMQLVQVVSDKPPFTHR